MSTKEILHLAADREIHENNNLSLSGLRLQH